MVIPAAWIPLPGTPASSGGILLAAVLAGWIMLAVDGLPPSALGFHGRARFGLREFLLGTAGGVGVGLGAVLLMMVFGALALDMARGAGVGIAAVGSLWFFAVPAAAEEALFRGYPLQAMAGAWGGWTALAVSSLAFGLLHGWNPGLGVFGVVNILMAGVFLGAIQLRTGSLWMASGVHLGWNWAHGFVVDLPVSGLDLVDNPAVDSIVAGPAWLSGGAFGPEASVAGSVALGAAAAWALFSPRLRPSPGINVERTLATPMGPGLNTE
jgi:membrane protease YdiL (CAAX protease family)